MWRADHSDQLRDTDRAEAGQLDQDPIVGVSARLPHQSLLGLPAEVREQL